MFFKKISIVLVVTLLAYKAFGQGRQYRFENYSVENGLSQNSAYTLHFDHKGYLWVGTADGLDRFDGYHFKSYRNQSANSCSIKNNFIRRILETPQGNFIIQTDVDIEFFNRKTNCFKVLLDMDYMRKFRLSATLVGGNDSIVWCFGNSGFLLKIDVKTGRKYKFKLPSSHYGFYQYDGLQLFQNNIYILLDSAFYHYKIESNQLIKIYTRKLKTRTNLVFYGNCGYFLDGTSLVKYDINSKKISTTVIRGYTNCQDNLLYISQIGEIYFSDKGIGLYKIRADSAYFIGNTNSDGDSRLNHPILSMVKDGRNNFWVGTDGGGVNKTNDYLNFFQHYSLKEKNKNGLNIMVKSFLELDKNRLMIGTADNGIHIVNLQTGKEEKTRDIGFPQNTPVYAMVKFEKVVLIGTQRGLYEYDPANNTIRKSSIPLDEVEVQFLAIFDNVLYIGTKNALMYFDVALRKLALYKGFSRYDMFGMKDREGRLWFTSLYEGILIKSKNRVLKLNKAVGLKSDAVRCVVEDKNGIFWAATEDGIARITLTKDFNFTIQNFSESEGLANGHIYGIVPTDDNHLWISSNKGLAYFDTEKLSVINFNIDDGLQSNEFNTGAFGKSSSGKIFFGGINGINVFNQHIEHLKTVNAPIMITSLIGGLKKLTEIPSGETVDFDYKENSIKIDFAWLDYTNPKRNIFRYRIDGIDDQWKLLGSTHELFFPNLKPGTYKLQLQAANEETNWSKNIYTLFLNVTPPWYLTWWFQSMAVLFFLAILLFVFYAISTRKLRKKIELIERQREIESIRTRISSDIHDEIGAGLSKISMYSEMATKQANQPDEIQDKLKRIGFDSRGLMDNLRDIVWAMNPENDSLQSLIAYMREYAGTYLEKTNISLIFIEPKMPVDLKVLPDFKRNIHMILKESLSNAVKYAACTEITIKLEVIENTFTFTVKDNGVGIDDEKIRKFNHGINGMEKRSKLIGATFQINSRPGFGTEIIIVGKL